MMPPVSVCHQLSWNGLPNVSRRPDDGLWVERLADARHEPQMREIVLPRDLGSDLHEHADCGRRGIPDGDPLILQDAVPALGVELGLIHDHGHAVRQRRDDAVGRAGDPAGIGRAPEDVVRMQIERELSGDVMGDHRRVHVDRSLRPTGGAAGEVEEGHILRTRALNVEGLRGSVHQHGKAMGAVGPCSVAVNEDNMAEAAEFVAPGSNFAAVEMLGSDEQLRLADAHAGFDGLGSERRKERAEDRPCLQGSQRGDIEFGNTAQEAVYAVALGDIQGTKSVGKSVGLPLQVAVGEVADSVILTDPAKGDFVAKAMGNVSVNRFIGDVQTATGQAVETGARLVPREVFDRPIIVTQV